MFGSEFITMRICVDMIESMRYKLRMFGIPIEGAANVFCDNNSVVTSPLKKNTMQLRIIGYKKLSLQE
jgi:hypothetical protein